MDHTDNDCLVIVVMTHGEPGKLYAKDDDYHLSELWEPFVGDNCPSLIGKPKLVFLQACRGDKMDRGSNARLSTFVSDAVDGQPTAGPVIFSIPTMADVLLMYATFDGEFFGVVDSLL
jgi:caspase 7